MVRKNVTLPFDKKVNNFQNQQQVFLGLAVSLFLQQSRLKANQRLDRNFVLPQKHH